MKFSVCYIIIILFCISCEDNSSKNHITFSEKEIKINDAVFGKNNPINFMIYNNSNDQLKIDEISSGCSCSSPSLEKRIIKPTDSAQVKVIYRPNLIGPDMQVITIKSNFNPEGDLIIIKAVVKDL